MKEMMTEMLDFEKIVEKCEQSQLASFCYRDAGVTIQFSKHLSEEDFNRNNEVLRVDSTTRELRIQSTSKNIRDDMVSEIAESRKVIEDNIVTLKSPFVGNIELSNQIKLGEGEITVKKGDIICSIEAMKIYNDIKSPVTGTIVKILTEDCSLVEFEQPIVNIRVDKHE